MFSATQTYRQLEQIPTANFLEVFGASLSYNLDNVLNGNGPVNASEFIITTNATSSARIVGALTRPVNPGGTVDRNGVVGVVGEEDIEAAMVVVEENGGTIVAAFVTNDLNDVGDCFNTESELAGTGFCQSVVESSASVGADAETVLGCVQDPTSSLQCQSILPTLLEAPEKSGQDDRPPGDESINEAFKDSANDELDISGEGPADVDGSDNAGPDVSSEESSPDSTSGVEEESTPVGASEPNDSQMDTDQGASQDGSSAASPGTGNSSNPVDADPVGELAARETGPSDAFQPEAPAETSADATPFQPGVAPGGVPSVSATSPAGAPITASIPSAPVTSPAGAPINGNAPSAAATSPATAPLVGSPASLSAGTPVGVEGSNPANVPTIQAVPSVGSSTGRTEPTADSNVPAPPNVDLPPAVPGLPTSLTLGTVPAALSAPSPLIANSAYPQVPMLEGSLPVNHQAPQYMLQFHLL
ncbi:hypothetical protein SEMRO_1984_G309390.1 [Seminavis robusta]|uniref:Uncharacterized protein n=1 Tax=Seminavis robusta TaxID=568900 RepID=A0A9N8EYJ0_9STRA|nr:hypothetical protein SEMRO_1984_G309390.1 [Seminavis robusta]|eukprot:Sro1984_g309390.1 n/a (475) ;mRNA; r:16516-17940